MSHPEASSSPIGSWASLTIMRRRSSPIPRTSSRGSTGDEVTHGEKETPKLTTTTLIVVLGRTFSFQSQGGQRPNPFPDTGVPVPSPLDPCASR